MRKKEKINPSIVDHFVGECCLVNKKLSCPASILYKKFSKWYPDHPGQFIPTLAWFGTQLSRRYKKAKIHGLIFYQGIDLRNI